MEQSSLFTNLEFNESKPVITVLFETSFTKEIRITKHAGIHMKKHQTAFPIVVELVEGMLDFGVKDSIFQLEKGSLIALESSVPHDLKTNCVIRLTLTKSDVAERANKVNEK